MSCIDRAMDWIEMLKCRWIDRSMDWIEMLRCRWIDRSIDCIEMLKCRWIDRSMDCNSFVGQEETTGFSKLSDLTETCTLHKVGLLVNPHVQMDSFIEGRVWWTGFSTPSELSRNMHTLFHYFDSDDENYITFEKLREVRVTCYYLPSSSHIITSCCGVYLLPVIVCMHSYICDVV